MTRPHLQEPKATEKERRATAASDFPPEARSPQHNLRSIIIGTGLYTFGGGVISLLGWVLDIPDFTDWDNNGISIQPNATICVMLSGLAVLLLAFGEKKVASTLGIVVSLIGGLTFFEIVSGTSLGIDTLLLFDRPWGRVGVITPGRMGPPGSLSWLLIGSALILTRFSSLKLQRYVPIFASLAMTISSISIVAYLYRAYTLFSVPNLTVIALQTATFIFAISTGLLISVPTLPPVSWLLNGGAAGIIARRSLPIKALLPLLFGWLFVVGQHQGMFDPALGTTVLVISLMLMSLLTFWLSFRSISRHETALQRSQERVTDTLESITDGFVTLDRDWRYVYVNAEAEKLLEKSREQLLGRSVWDIFPESFERTAGKELHRASAGRITVEFEDFNPVLNRWFSNKAYPCADGGISVYFQDVTDRKQLEEERQDLLASERIARSEAERASRMKDEFLATLSHELRTPLNGILGYAQLFRRSKMDKTKLDEAMVAIERNARVQAQMIDDLLDMNRIITGKARLDLETIELPDVISQAIDTVLPSIEAKEIHLVKLFDPKVELVRGDPARIQQVVWNLLSNAIKFTPKGGRIQVALERVESHVEIVVTDSGGGIEPAFLPHVFDRFRQADGSTTKRYGGLGLGLSIVRQLVELHGGTIRATSPGIGGGATFTVSLPVMAVQHEASLSSHDINEKAANGTYGEADLSGLDILMVDDERDGCTIVKRLLEECKAKVEIALSADEAMIMLEKRKFDVLVSDVGMPGEDGYCLIRRVRETSELNRKIPAVALTALARPEDKNRAVLAGFQNHLAKPVDAGELVAMVAGLSGRGSTVRFDPPSP